jgi:hypothetical protein
MNHNGTLSYQINCKLFSLRSCVLRKIITNLLLQRKETPWMPDVTMERCFIMGSWILNVEPEMAIMRTMMIIIYWLSCRYTLHLRDKQHLHQRMEFMHNIRIGSSTEQKLQWTIILIPPQTFSSALIQQLLPRFLLQGRTIRHASRSASFIHFDPTQSLFGPS